MYKKHSGCTLEEKESSLNLLSLGNMKDQSRKILNFLKISQK